MKKRFLAAFAISFGLLQFSCSKEENPIQPEENITPSEKKEWTFLLYDDADFSNAYDPMNDFSKVVSSDSNINYLVLQDGNKSNARYYRIGEQHQHITLKILNEINMGDKSSLENFLNYAKKYFPAERYIVAFYDHGGGWRGACWDVTNQNDNLTPAEINNALSNAGGVDFVLFTAPCLMGSVESAYQLRNSTKYYIGSEDLSGFTFWRGMLDKFDAFLKNNSSVSSHYLAKEIITLHDQNKNAYGYGALLTMSAVDLSKIGNLISSFNNVTTYYADNIVKYRAMPQANVRRYATDYCDLLSLLKSFRENETESAVNNQLTETINLLDDCIVAECHGDSTIGSNGLNIYYPAKKYTYETYYSPYAAGLDFKSDCSWDRLISSSLSKSESSSPEEQINKIFRLNGYRPN